MSPRSWGATVLLSAYSDEFAGRARPLVRSGQASSGAPLRTIPEVERAAAVPAGRDKG